MIISKTPLRISFVGGGTDLKAFYKHGYGAVVSTAIDKYVYITVNKTFAGHIRIGYSKVEYKKKVKDIQHNLVREALKLVGIKKGIEIFYMSDMLPAHEGSGLGASSSITVGTLNALHAFKKEYVSAKKLAEEACKIEIQILGEPIGKQDQYAAAYGGFNYIKFKADESVEIDPVIFKLKNKLKKKLLMFYIGDKPKTRVVLSEQTKKTIQNLEVLRQMSGLAKELKKSLEKNNLSQFADLLHQNWLLKQKLSSKITNPKINEYYQKARNVGALGGKILGSGGGGFLLLYCEEKNQKKVRKALKNLRESHFNFESQGSKIIYVSD